MARSISTYLFIGNTQTTTFLVPAGSSINLSFHAPEANAAEGLIQVSYPQTSTPTNVSTNVFYGFGGAADASINVNLPVPCKLGSPYTNGSAIQHGSTIPIWSTNSDAITMSAITAGQGTPQGANSSFILNNLQNPKWLEFQFINKDLVNPATIQIPINIGM